MRPKKHLDYYSHIYPDAWSHVDSMRSDRGKELPWWPEWCFLPLAGSYSIVSAEAEQQGVISDQKLTAGPLVNDVGIIGALAAWRVTQGIYRFDPDVFKSVIDTPINGDLPHEVFFNLPEWCVYIETPELLYLGQQLYGFFAHLEYDANTSRKEMRLVLDLGKLLMSVPIHLGAWSLIESIERVVKESNLHVGTPDQAIDVELLKQMKGELESLVSLLLYICSTNGEIGTDEQRPTKPRSTKTKKGPRLFPPNTPRTWDVGVKMGSAIRRYQSKSPEKVGESYSHSHRASPRTHIRRAHWQGFWSGPRNVPDEREYLVKWMYPLIINPTEDGDIPITIRPVK